MEVSSIKANSNNNQAFGKTILDNAKLQKKALNGAYKQADAFISKLTYGDAKDISLMEKIQNQWRKYSTFSEEIIYNFKTNANKNIYMTELKNKCLKIKDKVCCLMMTTNPKKSLSRETFHIDLLQSAPAIADKGIKSPIKGAGELTVYEAVKEAKKEGYKKVQLTSIKDGFYSKIGFKNLDNSDYHIFVLENKDYDNFLKRIEKKYNICK